jgi:hypothetical protein
MLGAAHLLASVEETNRVAETVSKKARELDSTIVSFHHNNHSYIVIITTTHTLSKSNI